MNFRSKAGICSLLFAAACGSRSAPPVEGGISFPPTALLPPIPRSLDPHSAARDFGDVLRNDHSVDDTLNDAALTAVTRDFGPSIIRTAELPYKSEVATAATKPWSSWWYPKREDTLFNDTGDSLSALSKYDWLRKRRANYSPDVASAADFERKSFNPRALLWEGLCDAWALASISKPEPRHDVTMTIFGTPVTFSITDLKGLLLKTYEAVEDTSLKYYGQKFTGDYNGWIYPDLFPDQFHRFVEVELFEKKRPFIMDHDPGVEVWNVPVYKSNYLVDRVPDNPDAVFIRNWIYSAESSLATDKNFTGTRQSVREYDYVLTGTRNAAGDLVVSSGYWVKGPDGIDSRKEHPDYVIEVADPSSIVRKSWNPEIDISLVDEILSHSY